MSDPETIPDHERKRRDLEQLSACKAELAGAISRQIDWLLYYGSGRHVALRHK